MGWPSVPTISRPLRDGLVATYPRSTRPFAGHLQLLGSAVAGLLVVFVVVDFGGGVAATCLGGAAFLVAGGGVLLVCVVVELAPGVFIPLVCTVADLLLRLMVDAGADMRKD